VSRLAATKPVSALLSHFIQDLDRAVAKLSKGRTNATEILTGLSVLWVTTIGVRTGQPRTYPLFGIPHGDGLALIGSRLGSAPTPSWVFNLRANPAASARWRETELSVIARRLSEEEAAPVWEAASVVYPGFRYYRQRASHRKIEVFLLETA